MSSEYYNVLLAVPDHACRSEESSISSISDMNGGMSCHIHARIACIEMDKSVHGTTVATAICGGFGLLPFIVRRDKRPPSVSPSNRSVGD